MSKYIENESLMFCLFNTICVSSKSGLGDKMFLPSNLVDYPNCILSVMSMNLSLYLIILIIRSNRYE